MSKQFDLDEMATGVSTTVQMLLRVAGRSADDIVVASSAMRRMLSLPGALLRDGGTGEVLALAGHEGHSEDQFDFCRWFFEHPEWCPSPCELCAHYRKRLLSLDGLMDKAAWPRPNAGSYFERFVAINEGLLASIMREPGGPMLPAVASARVPSLQLAFGLTWLNQWLATHDWDASTLRSRVWGDYKILREKK